MKVPLKWLKEYVPLDLAPEEIARRLTLAGLEAREIRTAGDWDNVLIGKITAVNPHPDADRLRLATVNLGDGQETVVCGAPNLTPGDKIIFARVGARLIDAHSRQSITLKPAKIRGVESRGMICSEQELGISDSHEGIVVLPPEAPLGIPLADYLGDIVFDLEVTPNRADCLSVIGVAREAAALTGHQIQVTEASYEEAVPAIDRQVSVEILDPELCPRYCASLITGVKVGESPVWMQERLAACGMRPINNVVDITNYVMLEYGQPLHAFDYAKIKGHKIIVRRASPGETIDSLDGAARQLTPDMLVIADAERPVAIAGVMGGANSEVSDGTTTILLESANFKPTSIHYTARHLLLSSEASMRFERGIRPGLTVPALKRATRLMLELAGGQAAEGIADVYPGLGEPEPIPLSLGEIKRVLGIEYSLDQVTGVLSLLGFRVEETGSVPELRVTPPYWRGDVSQEVDLIEEVARIIGYDGIPLTLLGEPLPHQKPEPVLRLLSIIQEYLTGHGFQEVITFSLAGLETLKKLSPQAFPPDPLPLRLANPMTAEQEFLRPNLRTGLLGALAANRRHEDGGMRLFELSRVYRPREKDLPAEPLALCAVMSGNRVDKSWLGEAEAFSFFDAKGMVEGLLHQAVVQAAFVPGRDEGLHPAKQVSIMVAGQQIGVAGELHPRVAANFEIAEPVYLLEIDVSELLPLALKLETYQAIPRFPGTVRDLALVVDAAITHQQLHDIIRSSPLVSEVTVFDVYSGKQVPPGKKSLAYRIVYQSLAHTLTDEEVDRAQEKILNKLSRVVGATLRS